MRKGFHLSKELYILTLSHRRGGSVRDERPSYRQAPVRDELKGIGPNNRGGFTCSEVATFLYQTQTQTQSRANHASR